jgi:hypothetical protein
MSISALSLRINSEPENTLTTWLNDGQSKSIAPSLKNSKKRSEIYKEKAEQVDAIATSMGNDRKFMDRSMGRFLESCLDEMRSKFTGDRICGNSPIFS